MKKNYIDTLINLNKECNNRIPVLEQNINDIKIENDKDKANFGNLCLILKSSRIIADATEAMLANEDVLMDENGNYYQKIEDTPDKGDIGNTRGKQNPADDK